MLAWVAALALCTLARYGSHLPDHALRGALEAAVVAGVVVLLVGSLNGLHRGRYVIASFDETTAMALVFAPAAVAVVIANAVASPALLPRSSALSAGPVALVLAFVPRYIVRQSHDVLRRRRSASATRVLVFGAGDTGAELVRLLTRDRRSSWLPVGLLDDEPLKRDRSVAGVRVLGDRTAIARVAFETKAQILVVAVPDASPELKQEITNAAYAAGLSVRVLPALSELVDSAVAVDRSREITEADLLGRPQLGIDLDAVSALLDDRVVLVTGAGGSIGSEICRQLSKLGPQRLVMVDRDESALHGLQLSMEGAALLSDPNIVVADIRDTERLREVFRRWRPSIVFHAAALKHLALLEMHPEEGIKTNVWGTRNMIDVALEFDVECFVNISTDKAADPVSVLGYTKLLAERLTAEAATRTPNRYLSVRFGNVLGSRGSVLPTFRAQIESGGPVTVTDPDVTRYFMTTEEASQLVLQAVVIGESGEVLILDMGTPVRIDDVARRLIAQSGRPVEVRYTGLRVGEKLHERLVADHELAQTRQHPLIMHTRVAPVSRLDVEFMHADSLRLVSRSAIDDSSFPVASGVVLSLSEEHA